MTRQVWWRSSPTTTPRASLGVQLGRRDGVRCSRRLPATTSTTPGLRFQPRFHFGGTGPALLGGRAPRREGGGVFAHPRDGATNGAGTARRWRRRRRGAGAAPLRGSALAPGEVRLVLKDRAGCRGDQTLEPPAPSAWGTGPLSQTLANTLFRWPGPPPRGWRTSTRVTCALPVSTSARKDRVGAPLPTHWRS